ncbi:glycosyltransferase [Granulicella cerasi]|uniref:Glycosyltransferase n=1 Tax=Granulicella cerasi TaxID=741063 RepID=A0ABW1Z653_9BACT|nr:glycosyltransferase [Granulicella cerasi]
MSHAAEQPQQPLADRPAVRLGYYVSHPIQYQAPLLRRISQEPDIDLTVLFGSDFSVRSYKDEGFGVAVEWDVPLLDGYKHEFLKPIHDKGGVSSTTPISLSLVHGLQNADGSPRFDALWVHGYASVNALRAIMAANALGIPVLLRAESWLADRARSPLKLALKKMFFDLLGRGVAGVLPIGTHNAQYWRHYWGDSVPQFLFPYAVDNSYFAQRAIAATPNLAKLRAELQLEADRPVVLFASKLQERKHANHLVEAYARFVSKRTASEPKPYLVIVGDGEERKNLHQQVAALGLDADVRFAGFRNQSELPAFFAMSSVFVLPSRHEPWGLIVNESMASGCPVIVSTDVGSALDLVADGVEGCVYPVGDVDALTESLARVFATPDTPRQMGEAARLRMTTWSFEEDVAGLRAALAHTTRKLIA